MTKLLITLSFVLFSTFNAFCQFPRSIEAEINRYEFDLVLLIPEMSIDEYPIWSADSKNIGVNVLGTWFNLPLDEVALGQADWKKQLIGYNYYDFLDSLDAAHVTAYQAATEYNPRKLYLEDSSFYELRLSGFTTGFIHGQNNGQEKLIFNTGGDNCHSLSIAPNGKFLTFISEGNGLMLYVLDKTYFASAITDEQRKINEVIKLLDSKNSKWAMKVIKRELKEHPNNSEAHYFTWKSNFEQGKFKQALKSLNFAIAIEPNRPFYQFCLGETYFQTEEYDKSIEAYKKFIALRPYHYYAYFNMGYAYKYAEQYDLACEMFQKISTIYRGRARKEIQETCIE